MHTLSHRQHPPVAALAHFEPILDLLNLCLCHGLELAKRAIAPILKGGKAATGFPIFSFVGFITQDFVYNRFHVLPPALVFRQCSKAGALDSFNVRALH